MLAIIKIFALKNSSYSLPKSHKCLPKLLHFPEKKNSIGENLFRLVE